VSLTLQHVNNALWINKVFGNWKRVKLEIFQSRITNINATIIDLNGFTSDVSKNACLDLHQKL